jgi:CRISPR-associated exonuclease Cas4
MYAEDDLLPLSGLQHLTFCERRWALVQIESLWEENRFTAEGRLLHERAHSSEIESRPGVLIRRTLPLRSFRLGISGQADIVEFEPTREAGYGVTLPERRGFWRPFPVEYKRHKDRGGSHAYAVQLCAQAICLEEMMEVSVPGGAVYDGTTRRRTQVEFTAELRRTVERAAARMHELYRLRLTPLPVYTKLCEKCSMLEVCQPKALTTWSSVDRYLASALASDAQADGSVREPR